MYDPEIDDTRRSQSTINKVGRGFAVWLIGVAISAVLVSLMPEGFLLPYVIAYMYVFWEISVWSERRQFRKELRALDRPGWDR